MSNIDANKEIIPEIENISVKDVFDMVCSKCFDYNRFLNKQYVYFFCLNTNVGKFDLVHANTFNAFSSFKEVKHIPWNKKAILKELKLKLDLDKANDLVRNIKQYKHNKKKSELESKLRLLVQNNVYFLEAFGEEIEIIKGERHGVHHSDRIAKWDKDDLPLFEDKILKLELAKSHMDEKERIQKPIDDRIKEYKQIDGQLLEALIEKLEEDRPEKMIEYLKLRKEIKDKHPLED